MRKLRSRGRVWGNFLLERESGRLSRVSSTSVEVLEDELTIRCLSLGRNSRSARSCCWRHPRRRREDEQRGGGRERFVRLLFPSNSQPRLSTPSPSLLPQALITIRLISPSPKLNLKSVRPSLFPFSPHFALTDDASSLSLFSQPPIRGPLERTTPPASAAKDRTDSSGTTKPERSSTEGI